MDDKRRILVAWLRDAHAMDRAALDNLRQQIRRSEDHPDLAARLQEQCRQHRQHLEQVEDCLGELGASPSGFKDAAMRAAGVAEVWIARIAPDDVVKNLLATHAYAWFGVGSYCALAEAAEACGERRVAETCRGIMEERRRSAEWLGEQLGELAREEIRHPSVHRRSQGADHVMPAVIRDNPMPAAVAVAAVAGAGLLALVVNNRRRRRISDFESLYLAELQELASAEAQVGDLLEKAARSCGREELELLISQHARASSRLRGVLEDMLRQHGESPYRHEDQAMSALAGETRKMMDMAGRPPEVGDVGLIGSLQRLAHYQIASFGTAASWAGDLGFHSDRSRLHEAAGLKRAFDERLNAFARGTSNPDARDRMAS